MHKRHICIQEHNAEKAGLHWDLRIESRGDLETYDAKRPWTNEPRGAGEDRVLISFAIPKARLPRRKEFLLAMQTEDHPWKYKDFEGRILEGYGKGEMQLLHSSPCNFTRFEDKTIVFEIWGAKYLLFQPKKPKKPNMWLIKKIASKDA